jgi:hypothetical protein
MKRVMLLLEKVPPHQLRLVEKHIDRLRQQQRRKLLNKRGYVPVPLVEVCSIFGSAFLTAVLSMGLYVVAETMPALSTSLYVGAFSQIGFVLAGLVYYGMRLIDREYA